MAFGKDPEAPYQSLDINQEIDFVYSYVDSNHPKYQERLKHWYDIDGDYILDKKRNFNDRYFDFNELHYSLLFLQKFVPTIRKIFIVTPTPETIQHHYRNNPKIHIVNDDDILPDTITKPTFRSTVIESYLHKIDGLANLFFYACDDMFIGSTIEKHHIFDLQHNVPYATLERYGCDFSRPARHRNTPFKMDIINANLLIQRNFNIIPSLCHNHQIVLVRKDVCKLTHKIYGEDVEKNGLYRFRYPTDYNLHFMLLQHFVGIIHGMYSLKMMGRKEDMNLYLGFYPYNAHDPWKRFYRILKHHPTFFCLNYIQPENMMYTTHLILNYHNHDQIDRPKKFLICYKDKTIPLHVKFPHLLDFTEQHGTTKVGYITSLPQFLCRWKIIQGGVIEWCDDQLLDPTRAKIIFVWDGENRLAKFNGNENYDIICVNINHVDTVIPELSYFSCVNSDTTMHKKDKSYYKHDYKKVIKDRFNVIFRNNKSKQLAAFVSQYPKEILH